MSIIVLLILIITIIQQSQSQSQNIYTYVSIPSQSPLLFSLTNSLLHSLSIPIHNLSITSLSLSSPIQTSPYSFNCSLSLLYTTTTTSTTTSTTYSVLFPNSTLTVSLYPYLESVVLSNNP